MAREPLKGRFTRKRLIVVAFFLLVLPAAVW
jgi:hypothetical protein